MYHVRNGALSSTYQNAGDEPVEEHYLHAANRNCYAHVIRIIIRGFI